MDKETKNKMNNQAQPDTRKGFDESYISDGVVADASDEMALDDARRIKVLSPNALVMRRFLRNRLAIVGLVILILMFLFSFLGGALSPYGEDQQFYKMRSQFKQFAGITDNTEYRYTRKEGADFGLTDQAAFIGGLKQGEQGDFVSGDVRYTFNQVNPGTYIIYGDYPVAKGLILGKRADLTMEEGYELTKEFEEAVLAAARNNESRMEIDGEEYFVNKVRGKEYEVRGQGPVAIGSTAVLAFDSPEYSANFDFRLAVEEAIKEKQDHFQYEEQDFRIEYANEKTINIYQNDQLFAILSTYVVQTVRNDFINLAFKQELLQAALDGVKTLENEENEKTVEYEVIRTNDKWRVNRETETTVLNSYDRPSAEHIVGTDANGMDLMTRLMYGGRISLMVGFVVVIISMVIGVILGGISGYFGGWVDMLIMRIVDIFYCIPFYPVIIIMGSLMDAMDIRSTERMFMLMVILGFLGWAGIARMVRGQILSLREEEYMVAAEATGLSTRRRIMKHLIPNVMPLLIVSATMSLGGTILTESTLSFLGLGVKYPFASWGNIINAVSNQHVMTEYPFVWIPAGICIVLTVVAFNFVGDGLRDAYDPKMKR